MLVSRNSSRIDGRSSSGTSSFKCTNCDSEGHSASHCLGRDVNGRQPSFLTSDKSGNNRKSENRAFLVGEQSGKTKKMETTKGLDDSAKFCFLNKIETTNAPSGSSSWIIKSGCTTRMTFERSLFKKYEQMLYCAVEMGTKNLH